MRIHENRASKNFGEPLENDQAELEARSMLLGRAPRPSSLMPDPGSEE